MNITNLDLQKNLDFYKTPEYEKYNDYLVKFFSLKTCPINSKYGFFRIEDESEYKAECDKNTDWFLKIKRGIRINLYEELRNITSELNIAIKNLMTELEKNIISTDEVEELKKEINKKTDDKNHLEKIILDLNKFLTESYQVDANLELELTQLFEKRKELFTKTQPIPNDKLNSLVSIFKTEKMPNRNRLESLAKDYNIHIDNITAWLEWIDVSILYAKKQLEQQEYFNKLSKEEKINEQIISNFYVKKPEILDPYQSKKITVKVKKGDLKPKKITTIEEK